MQSTGARAHPAQTRSELPDNSGGSEALPDRVGQLLRLVRNPVGAAGLGRLGEAAAALLLLVAVAAPASALRGAAQARRPRALPGSPRQCRRPVARQCLTGLTNRFSQCLLRLARPPTSVPSEALTRRTAVSGPVRTVVWEGRSRETLPYPDSTSVGMTDQEVPPCY